MAKESIYSLDEKTVENFDWTTFFSSIILVLIGLLSVYSATSSYAESFFYKQMISAGVGFIAMIAVIFIPYRTLKFYAYWIYSASIILLILVLAIGIKVHGTRGWIPLGTLTLQPAEFAKLGLILGLSKFLSRKGRDVRSLQNLGKTFLFLLPGFLLVMLQPDVGSASVLAAIYLGILFWTGFDAFILYVLAVIPFVLIASLADTTIFYVLAFVTAAAAFLFKRNVIITLAVGAIIFISGLTAPVVYNNLAPHQKSRIDTFLDPGSDPRGSGYNVIQSKLAVGSGGVTGKGFKQGTLTQLRYIPEQWTDFIYSVPTEEFGFIGGSLIIILFIVLILRAVKIASENEKSFYSVMSFGIAIVLLYHIIINIGMVIGLMPVMGIPLPFLSYGGTSMVFNLTLIGLLLNAHRNQKIK